MLPYIEELRDVIKELRRFNNFLEKHDVNISFFGSLMRQVDAKNLMKFLMGHLFSEKKEEAHHGGTEDTEPKEKGE